MDSPPITIDLSAKKFLLGCGVAALALFGLGSVHPIPGGIIATELMLTILGLFIFGSIRYRLDKNALTVGSGLVVIGTFWGGWWPQSGLRAAIESQGAAPAIGAFLGHHLFSLTRLEETIHIDTMLFILGLTFMVSVIAQTRILESMSFAVLRRYNGRMAPTIILIAGIVAVASAILGGVSMVGLYIRTMVILLVLARADDEALIFAVIMATVLTTVSGVFLAYGEPPNLIMKTNLHPYLDNAFFLRYGLPVAIGSYLIVAWHLKRYVGTTHVDLEKTDLLDRCQADVRFLQAARHGEVINSLELVDRHASDLGSAYEAVRRRVHHGESAGEAFIHEGVPETLRRKMLGHYVSEDLAEALDIHFAHAARGDAGAMDASEKRIRAALAESASARIHAQRIAMAALGVFVILLVAHTFYPEVLPLFVPAVAGFVVSLAAVWTRPRMRALALQEGVLEYKEYLFLFPLFLSITLLQKTGFFDGMTALLQQGIRSMGASTVAYIQYWIATFLSAILDNNVVADFASRALHGLGTQIVHYFSMAQIAGYAVGGCWTHIGCAQSVVAFAFILKEIDERYTPWQWIKAMTVVIFQISLFMTVLIYAEGMLLR